MKIAKYYKEKIDELMGGRGMTKFHITGIRHCDYKDKADDFIREAAKKLRDVILMPEEANPYDPESVVCYSGNKQVGYVSTYDLEKYYILAGKNDADHLTGHFFFGNTGDHLLDLSVAGTIKIDNVYDYRKEIDKQKDGQYGSWKHDAIKSHLVHSRHQNAAKACISQMKDAILKLFFGYSSTTQEELLPLLEQYKESSQYDISLEGQRDRWDILLYLDYLYDAHHKPGQHMDEFYEKMLATVTEVCSQIGGELGRSVSYTAYVERLKGLFTEQLPSSETAQHYLNTKPDEVFNEIRQQIQNFPHHLYHLFHTNPEEFVRTIYYARIPRKYLDPFLSGIALVEAYDNNKKEWKENYIASVTTEEGDGKLNYEAPKINLQHLLKQPWFVEARSEEKYDSKWTDAFVEALMGSEYGEGIARDWAWNIGGERNRHIQIKGYVVGLLVDAGVLKGSKRTIAKRIVEERNDKNLAEEDFWKEVGNLSRNMYTDTAGKQPYAQWVKGYEKRISKLSK